ncbi:MFS transporter [Virgibacillus sp. LDC-1]|uniref:MFS transporter n=1 Tax=Virgibacillus sp. LDC-1 TaxID=3039856 RepID=UPI0024DE2996|nr:MFS transporter [Virgibacillus sp. LDC-1]
MRVNWSVWKHPFILLNSVGIAGIGDFIYLIAINLLVFDMTGSAAAVAGLWIIGPFVNVVTKFWTGSFIDYRSKRKIMMITYIARGVFIFCIPFSSNIMMVYFFLICISIAKSFFVPSSMTYTTQLVPKKLRKRYNSIHALTSSGAFIIGPAVAGTLILMTSIKDTLFINAGAFILAALLLLFLPDKEAFTTKAPAISLHQIKQDWTTAVQFLTAFKYVAIVYGAYLTTTIFSFAMDTQEVVFTQQVVGLSQLDYSLLISITGIGSIIGAFLLAIFTQKLSLQLLIAIGIFMQTVGYLFYAFSWSFFSIAFGFTVLGFFNAFLNAGMMTFYQNNVPTELMGRVTSILQLLQSSFQIIFVLMVGVTAEVIPLRVTIILLAFGMLILAMVLIWSVSLPSKKRYFEEAT